MRDTLIDSLKKLGFVMSWTAGAVWAFFAIAHQLEPYVSRWFYPPLILSTVVLLIGSFFAMSLWLLWDS